MRDEPVKLMTVNQRLIQALCPLRLPVEPEVDTRYQSRCITFNYDLLPVQFADNRPILHKALIQVHLFLPLTENSVRIRWEVAQALADGGFGWPEITDASDSEGQHFVFETETITKQEELTWKQEQEPPDTTALTT